MNCHPIVALKPLLACSAIAWCKIKKTAGALYRSQSANRRTQLASMEMHRKRSPTPPISESCFRQPVQQEPEENDPEIQRLKRNVADDKAKAMQKREMDRSSMLELNLAAMREPDDDKAKAMQKREIVESSKQELNLAVHEGVSCHFCGWKGSVRDLNQTDSHIPNQVIDAKTLCPSCQREFARQQPSRQNDVYKTEYSTPTSKCCCLSRWSIL